MRISSLKLYMPGSELARRTYAETLADDGLGLAAQLAYYFFLALVPALLFFLALASFFQLSGFIDILPSAVGRFAAPEMVELLRKQLQQISNARNGGILSLGLLGALWSSSAALVSIITVLNRAYDIEESRPWWKVRLIAIALTVGLAAFVMVSLALVMAGPSIGERLAITFGLQSAFMWTWSLLQWPLAIVMICVAVGLVYYWAPDAEQEWVWVTPGALVATGLWLMASLLFRLYVMSFGDYQATYGALGGVVVLLLWMYMSGLVIIIGAEINAEIEHASPWGKEPGEKIPGQRQKIGVAAERAFRERPTRPSPHSPAKPVFVPSMVPAERVSLGEWLLAQAVRIAWPRSRRRTP